MRDLIQVLSSGSFDGLVGVTEDGRVDFKRAPYSLSTEHGKFELAKDVVAFANGREEALLVIGVETERTEDSPLERAAKVRPIPRSLVDEKQHLAVIRERCYPVPRGVAVTAYPSAADASRCLLAVHVPVQRDDDRPFLVLSPLGASGEKIQGWLVGLPTRALDETEQARPTEIHELIARGANVATRLEEIAIMVAHRASAAGVGADTQPGEGATAGAEPEIPPSPFAHAFARGRVEAALRRFATEPPDVLGEEKLGPSLYLVASPIDTVTVPTIFRAGGVREKLENPPVSRYNGWNLFTGSRAEIAEGTHLRLASGRRHLIEFYEDGTLLGVARFDRLLVRVIRETAGGAEPPSLKVSSLALIEYTHDFVLTYAALLDFMEPRPERIRFGVGVRSAISWPGGRIFLPPGAVGTFAWELADFEPPDTDSFDRSFVASATEGLNVGAVAFELLQRLYPYFKHTVEKIPYLNDARTEVDPSRFGPPT